ncbi:MAG: response regulator [SAR324 cluster bacterium]|nr:response regulator [SAR324 cluster bacterium]
MIYKVRLTLLFVLLLFIPTLISAKTSYQFHHAFDLGSQASYNVIEDQDGFLWFTSLMGGLIRYDGTSTRVYRAGPNSIASDFTTQIIEDNKGRIWIGTNNGLSRYDKSTNHFVTFYKDPDNLKQSLAGNTFNHSGRTISADSDGNLWIGTQTGVSKFDLATERFTSFFHEESNPNSLSGDNIFSVFTDSRGYVWVGGRPGMTRINPKTLEFKRFRHQPDDPTSLPDDNIQAIVEDHHGNLWMATMDNGLIKLDHQTGQFTQYKNDPNDPKSFPSMTIWNLVRLQNGKIAIGTDTNPIGLFLWDPETATYEQFLSNPSIPLSLAGNNVQSHFEDKKGDLYIILSDGRIERYAPGADRFKVYMPNELDPTALASNSPYAIFQDSHNQMWIAHFGSGMDLFDLNKNTFTNFNHRPGDPTTIPHGFPSGFFQDHQGRMIVSTMLGMVVWDPVKKVVAEKLTDNTWLYVLHQDPINTDIIYGVGWEQGLHKFNMKTREHKIFLPKYDDPHSMSAVTSMGMIADPDDSRILWIATWGGGLDRFDTQNEIFTHFQHDPKTPNSISSNTVYDCHIDANGSFWVTTDQGLNLFDRKQGTFERIDFGPDVDARRIGAILEDDDGQLWLGTDVGIIQFDIANRRVVNTFTKEDGLPGYSFLAIAKGKSAAGDFFFAGSGMGLIRFNPKEFKENKVTPETVLTSLNQDGKEMALPQAVERTKEIFLDWQNNSFTFEYVALNYTNSLKNRYQYYLEGFDKDWYNAGSQRFGRYSSLPGGTYTLRIKGSNNDGYWSKQEQEVALKVIVESPPWLRWWAFVSYAIAAIVIVIGLIGFSLRRVRLRQEELEIQVAEKTAELQKTLETKERFFSIIAHDLKGPIGSLSIIFNEILTQPEDLDLSLFQAIKIRVKNTYQLLENLLTWARNQKGQLEYAPKHFAIADPIDQCMKIQKGQALQKGIQMLWQGDRELYCCADQDMVTTILRNLISNAIKFTPQGGTITIKTKQEGNRLVTSVLDTGVGIPDKTKAKLFKVGTKVESSLGTNKESGSGLGLILCYEFIEKNNGRIWVEDNKEGGSCFHFTLNLGEKQIEEASSIFQISPIHKSKLYLIAEDNPLHRKTTAKVFKDLGLTFEIVEDGQQVVDRVKQKHFDVVFMDIDMPVLDGIEALKMINSQLDNPPKVVALSSYLEIELSERLVEQNFSDFLNKPLSANHLIETLRRVITE